MMHVAHFSTLERTGGAARAALRLHRALLESGVQSTFVTHHKASEDPTVVGLDRRHGPLSFHLPAFFDQRFSQLAAPADGVFRSAAAVGRNLARALVEIPCDLVHLHWINGGFLRPEALSSAGRPLVWTLHDQWAFCGAEHYPRTGRFESGYREEAAATGPLGFDVDRWVFRRKQRTYASLQSLTAIAPSRWMRDCAERSVLLRGRSIEVIPYAVDTAVFKPLDRAAARMALRLPHDRLLVLFTALGATSDPRKGWPQLRTAVERLVAKGMVFELVVVGAASGPSLPVSVHWLGQLHDEVSLALACSAADVFVCPSLQENLPNTVIEALACGTPCVAFHTGGLPDLITHQENGFLARPFEEAELAAGISWVLADGQRRLSLCAKAREAAVRRFSPPVIAAQHLVLYERLLAADRR